ncbi:MAG: YitT family protein [Lachnospiraceae bacterium]|nr:YitT family protein [Lachnospiraceae bacterium]
MGKRIRTSETVYEEKKSIQRILFDYVTITAAAFLQGIAISLFLDPNQLAPGGVTGISVILSKITGLGTGTWILLLNVPILAIGLWKFGLRFLLSTLYCTVLVSSFTTVLSPFGPVTDDKLLAALAGSILMALGIGWVFKSGATTGGTDIIVKLIKLRYPHFRTGAIFLITDACIVTLSAFVFGDINLALYAGIAVAVTSFGLDRVLYGRDGAKLIYIISDSYEKITQRILQEMDIGVTHIQGHGAYSGKEKSVIMCVAKIQMAPRIEEIVKQEDAEAFMIVTSATEIYGEGYKSYFSEKL